MRARSGALFSLVIIGLALWALLATQGWAIKTALYPRVVGIPLLLLAAMEFVLCLRGAREPEERAMDVVLSEDVEPREATRRTVAMFAWIFGFFLAILALGFSLAIPLFVFAYLKIAAKERWSLIFVLVGLAWLLFYGLFIRVLHLPLPEGLLFHMLR